jgi:hypothetical protein
MPRNEWLVNPTTRELQAVGNGTQRFGDNGRSFAFHQPMPTRLPALQL